jgi:hypothetical protein
MQKDMFGFGPDYIKNTIFNGIIALMCIIETWLTPQVNQAINNNSLIAA